jgi:hypothetical protein
MTIIASAVEPGVITFLKGIFTRFLWADGLLLATIVPAVIVIAIIFIPASLVIPTIGDGQRETRVTERVLSKTQGVGHVDDKNLGVSATNRGSLDLTGTYRHQKGHRGD